MTDVPAVSVIVPVRDRPDLLERCLLALASQTFSDFEVVVIDDGSTNPVLDVVEAVRPKLDVTYVRTPGVGAVGARCAGVDKARGRIVAFTDSDCEPEPRWVEEGVRAIDDGADAVQGVTRPVRPPKLFERSLAFGGGEGLFATCNMFYRRVAFDAAGGFDRSADERLGFRPSDRAKGLGFGEDTLLGWRVARRGVVAVAKDAVVRHATVRDPVVESLSRSWQVGAFPALVREAPELRGTLLRSRLFLGSDSRVPLYVALTSLLLPFRWVTGIATAWWAFKTFRRLPRTGEASPTRIAALGVYLLIDVVKACALVVGSVRAKTVVL